MAFSFQAGQYEAGIEEYHRHLVSKTPSLRKVLKPREFAYALCFQKLGRVHFEKSDLLNAGRRMLQDIWLGGGQYTRAATWLKIVYWRDDETLTPLQVILNAYDDVPDVPRPNFVPPPRAAPETHIDAASATRPNAQPHVASVLAEPALAAISTATAVGGVHSKLVSPLPIKGGLFGRVREAIGDSATGRLSTKFLIGVAILVALIGFGALGVDPLSRQRLDLA